MTSILYVYLNPARDFVRRNAPLPLLPPLKASLWGAETPPLLPHHPSLKPPFRTRKPLASLGLLFLSCSFFFFHFLFIFSHFLSFSILLNHFLSSSFIFLHLLASSFILFVFFLYFSFPLLGAQNLIFSGSQFRYDFS